MPMLLRSFSRIPHQMLQSHSQSPNQMHRRSKAVGPKRRVHCDARLACKVCADDSTSGNNFGASTCLACAAFFRNSVAKARVYVCRFSQTCHVDKANRNGCRACRLAKCLRVGMKRELVRSNKSEMQVNNPPQMGVADVETARTLETLLQTEQKCARVLNSSTELSDAYIQQYASLEQLFASDENLLNRAAQFSETPPVPWNREAHIAELDAQGYNLCLSKYRFLDYFVYAGVAKTMPGFSRLALEDKVCLFRYVSLPAVQFCAAFYSAQWHADTVMKCSGLEPISYYRSRLFQGDQQVAAMSDRLYCKALGPYKELAPSKEEFVLLLAILLSHPAVCELSEHGRQLLYAECAGYSAHLLRLLQTRLGLLGGAQRYVALMGLVQHAFHAANFYRTFFTYVDVFYLHKANEHMLPAALKPIYYSAN